MRREILSRAVRLAREHLPRHPQLNCYPHYSFIVQENKIVEWATNMEWEPPLHFGYHARIEGGRAKGHSEIMAYRKARGILRKNFPFELINIRLSKRGSIRLSRPCECCYSFMGEMGCVRFWYSWEDGFLKI